MRLFSSLFEDAICSRMDANACADTDGCTIENEKSVCFCRDGYQLNDMGTLCIGKIIRL